LSSQRHATTTTTLLTLPNELLLLLTPHLDLCSIYNLTLCNRRLYTLLISSLYSLVVSREKSSPHSTPVLHWAIDGGHDRAVLTLLEKGADVDAVGMFGFTAVHYAVRNQRVDLLCLLLRYGARVDLEDFDGMTAGDHAKDFARRCGDDERAKILVRVLELAKEGVKDIDVDAIVEELAWAEAEYVYDEEGLYEEEEEIEVYEQEYEYEYEDEQMEWIEEDEMAMMHEDEMAMMQGGEEMLMMEDPNTAPKSIITGRPLMLGELMVV
jgi:hypothetical protein